MNHQQRKPTRPPTTTTAATEMPAIAPVERLTPVDTQLSPLGANPLLHIQALSLAVELSGQAVTHELPPGLAFLLDLHAEHLTRTVVVGLAIGVHSEQSAMPPLVLSLQATHFLTLSTVVAKNPSPQLVSQLVVLPTVFRYLSA